MDLMLQDYAEGLTRTPQLVSRLEIKQRQAHNMLWGLAAGSTLMLVVVGSYYGVEWLKQFGVDDTPTVHLRVVKYSELGPPPSMSGADALPQVGVSAAAVKPSFGIPVPVPDAQVNPDQSFSTQEELSMAQNPATEGLDGAAGGTLISDDIFIDEPGMNDFIPVEKEPQIVRQAKPAYPEIARQAGIEGVVFVKVLVGKDGKPKKAVVVKEIPPGIFGEAAQKAAMQYVFTPALMNTGPVQVWVSIPFRFRIVSTQPS